MSVERESALWEWWLRGLGGCLRRLDELIESGVRLEPRDVESLRFLAERMAGIASAATGQPRQPITHTPSWPVVSQWEKRSG